MLKILAALMLLSLPALAAETAYSSVIEDLPLMQGMTEDAGDAVVFDKPGGRIVETSADVAAPAAAVEDFYAQALPPLGWKRAGAGKYVRDNETISISVESKGGGSVARFSLTPAK